jgi:2-polyprenyl-3-methyl-5-hydroxy-6-metoxy-1,4-benzoquinol methylase
MIEQLKNISADVSWLDRVIRRYHETGRLIPERQEKLYRSISLQFAGGHTVLDVGSSLGIGSNILAHEARFVWGVDINKEAIDFAVKMFKRPNLDFEVIDIENPPTRELATFEIVMASEILEHVEDQEKALVGIKRFFTPNTLGFITCPNVANPEVVENENKHQFHLHHNTAGQFYELMTKHFNSVVMYSVDKLETWDMAETVDGSSTDYLIVSKVEGTK